MTPRLLLAAMVAVHAVVPSRDQVAEMAELKVEQARLKRTLEQDLKALDMRMENVNAAQPKPSEPVSPRGPRGRRLSHIAGDEICAQAATPSFPFAANSSWSTPAVERLSSQVTVSAGSYAPGVSWSLVCDGNYITTGGANYSTTHDIQTGTCTLGMTSRVPNVVSVTAGDYPGEVNWTLACEGLSSSGVKGKNISGGANYLAAPEIPIGDCTLTMSDSYGDGWNNAEWSAPGVGPFSIADGYSGSERFTVGVENFTRSGDGWNGSQWSAPGWNVGPFTLSSGGLGSQSFTVLPAATIEGAKQPFLYRTGGTPSALTGPTVGPGGVDPYYYTEAGGNGSEITVTAGAWPSEVSWKLSCSGLDSSIMGGANYLAANQIPPGDTCTLWMSDSYGDGWNGAEWSAPGVGPFSIASGFNGSASFTAGGGSVSGSVYKKTFTLGFDGSVQCGGSHGSVVASVNFEYHMYGSEIGTLSLKTAKGTTVWSRSGEQYGSTPGSSNFGWISSGKVPVNSASFHFEYAGATGLYGDAAVAQVQVCCPQPAQPITILVDDSVPHSFDDAAVCLHTDSSELPLTIREDPTSTVSAIRTPRNPRTAVR